MYREADIKQLGDKELMIKVRNKKRSIRGYIVALTRVTDLCLYHGCEAIKVKPIRNSSVKFYDIIPLCAIEHIKIMSNFRLER